MNAWRLNAIDACNRWIGYYLTIANRHEYDPKRYSYFTAKADYWAHRKLILQGLCEHAF